MQCAFLLPGLTSIRKYFFSLNSAVRHQRAHERVCVCVHVRVSSLTPILSLTSRASLLGSRWL